MTLNNVVTVIMRYFAKFDSLYDKPRQTGWSYRPYCL